MGEERRPIKAKSSRIARHKDKADAADLKVSQYHSIITAAYNARANAETSQNCPVIPVAYLIKSASLVCYTTKPWESTVVL